MKQAAVRQAEKDLQRQQAPAPPDAAVNFSPAVGELSHCFHAWESFFSVELKAKDVLVIVAKAGKAVQSDLEHMNTFFCWFADCQTW